MADDVTLGIGGDNSELKKELTESETLIERSAEQMEKSLEGVELAPIPTGLDVALGKAKTATKGIADNTKKFAESLATIEPSDVEGLQGQAETLIAVAESVTDILAAATGLRSAQKELNDEVERAIRINAETEKVFAKAIERRAKGADPQEEFERITREIAALRGQLGEDSRSVFAQRAAAGREFITYLPNQEVTGRLLDRLNIFQGEEKAEQERQANIKANIKALQEQRAKLDLSKKSTDENTKAVKENTKVQKRSGNGMTN